MSESGTRGTGMAQRKSGYAREAYDRYETPEWVTEALLRRFPPVQTTIWEPACGNGKISKVLERHALNVRSTDIEQKYGEVCDFLSPHALNIQIPRDWLITNPPYGPQGRTAVAFIERGLGLMERGRLTDLMALLLPIDFDSAVTRTRLFGGCAQFDTKMVLMRRIKWFDGPSSPSANHAWFVWRRLRSGGPPALLYGP